ncbi:MAG: alpha/beta hydrolase [Dysgonomonas sp.]|nr:alpha/beta hydrolase [Dysgonomonas sp.]
MINVYFISGLGANCKVFDDLTLPEKYEKNYIEWLMPHPDDTLDEYTQKMAESIDTRQPFILIGYSFGGIIVQEMNKFLHPITTIIIASIKSEQEMPPLLRFGRKINFAEKFPFWSLAENKKVRERLTTLLYGVKNTVESEYISYTSPVYLKWAVGQILNWNPTFECKNIYHIHGTRDNTFPHKYIKNAILIKGGDHLMVFKRSKKISEILSRLLIYDESNN